MSATAGPACANCASALSGPWCSQCGQRAEPHIHSLTGFLREATESLTHADSRLWRTILPLLARPGFLTREFLAGRRVRYLPPLRLYLVISVFFFLVLATLSGEASKPLEAAVAARHGGTDEITCSDIGYYGPAQDWVRPRLKVSCLAIRADGGRELLRSLAHNVPRAMFAFLPLIAALMKLLYWRPRRYYVEHLLFLVHNHAFAFLFLALCVVTGRLLPATLPAGMLPLLAGVYVAWYFFAAMRRVYGNGPMLTLVKLATIGAGYLVGGIVMLTLTLVVSAITL